MDWYHRCMNTSLITRSKNALLADDDLGICPTLKSDLGACLAELELWVSTLVYWQIAVINELLLFLRKRTSELQITKSRSQQFTSHFDSALYKDILVVLRCNRLSKSSQPTCDDPLQIQDQSDKTDNNPVS